MLETIANAPTVGAALWAASAPVQSRPAAVTADASLLMHLLDEVDYGMLLLGSDMQVVYRNHAAKMELDAEHPIQLVGNGLRPHRTQDVVPLSEALAGAQRGLRRLISLGAGDNRVSISVVPLSSAGESHDVQRRTLTLLVLGKRQVCGRLSLQGFARSAHLTPAETRVLELLCCGVRPGQIAQQQNVAVSTIRTQIGAIRAKTGASSISALVRQVALLPPMVGALRGMAPAVPLAVRAAH